MGDKRGLSSVVATVFLVLLSITLGGIIFAWALQFVGEKIEIDGQPVDEICKSILYDVQGEMEDNILDLWIVNRGNNDINGMDVKFVYDEGYIIKRFDVNVSTSDANNISIDITNNVTQLVLYPVVSGTVVGKRTKKPIRCEYSGKTFRIKNENI